MRSLSRFAAGLAISLAATTVAVSLAEAQERRPLRITVQKRSYFDAGNVVAVVDGNLMVTHARFWTNLPDDARSLAALRELINRLNQSLGRVDRLLAGRDQEIATLVENLNDISVNLKTLSESVAQHPAGLLFSAPPKPYEPPR